MTSLAKRPNGTWRARYQDPDNPRKQHSKAFARKVDAEAWLAEQVTRRRDGTWVDPQQGRRTFGEYAAEWTAAQLHHRPSTVDVTASRMALHVLPFFAERPLVQIRRSHVQGWVTGRAKVLKPATVEGVYRLFAQVMRSAVHDRMLTESPCRDIHLPEREHAELVIPSLEQVAALRAALPDHYAAAVTLGAGAGLRLGEVFGLCVDRIDFLRRTIRIDQQLLTPSNGPARLGPPKTRASVRTVPVGQVVLDELAAHLARWPRESLVFRTDTGAMVRRSTWQDAWSTARGKAKVSCRFHDLRHLHASLLIAKGLSVKVVQERLGHASAVETLGTYSHLWPSDEDASRVAVDDALGQLRDSSTQTRRSEAT